jgi:hypothetical protein
VITVTIRNGYSALPGGNLQATLTIVPIGVYGHTRPASVAVISTQPRL